MLKNNCKKILLVYIEPTPYILGLINAIEQTWQGKIDVLFLGENISQNWNIELNNQYKVLPKGKTTKLHFITRLFSKNTYDFIHLAGWGHPLLLLLIIIAKFTRTPVSIESDTSIPHHTQFWKRVVKRLLYPTFFKFINLFLPGGTRQAKYLQHYGVKPKHIIPAQMTVDIVKIKQHLKTHGQAERTITREQYGIQQKDVVFLFVGRLIEHKGVIDLISAFNNISNENAKLLIVGDGPLRPIVEDAARSNKKICYVGRLIGEKLIEAYYASNVFVLPSHFEPWGLVVNEAMAAGLPVIVSDRVGCIDDLVIHKKTGLVIKAEHVTELQTAIEYMTVSLQERLAMEKKSLKIIASWTLENEAKNICKAWDQLILA